MSAIKAEINERLKEHLRSFKKHCVALGVFHGDVPNLIGSGTLMKYGFNFYILTAAHLFLEQKMEDFWIFSGQNYVPLEGVFTHTDIDKSKDSNFEFCLIKLKTDLMKGLPEYKYFDLAEVQVGQTANVYNALFFVGFPWKRNRANKYTRKHKLEKYVFYGYEITSFNNPRFNVDTHCSIKIDRGINKCFNEKFMKVSAPPVLKGISGGPIFIMNATISSNRRKNVLIGICMEYDERTQYMYGIRISKILNLLQTKGVFL